jgi:cytochrome P450
VIFGQEYNLIGDPEHRGFVRDIERNNVRISVFYNDLNVQSWRMDKWLFPDAMFGRKAFLRYIGRFLQAAEKGGNSAEEKRHLFLILQDSKDPETGKRLSAAELRAETATLIAAGIISYRTGSHKIISPRGDPYSDRPKWHGRIDGETRECI